MTEYNPLCAWCDKPAQKMRRLDGEPNNRDACCDFHYAMYFARHTRPVTLIDMPSTAGRAGGKHKVGA